MRALSNRMIPLIMVLKIIQSIAGAPFWLMKREKCMRPKINGWDLQIKRSKQNLMPGMEGKI
ncbi:hypothetical protein GBFDFA_09440 [Edwardsiella anguillarum]|nr:hypothetical protein QY76_10760 [Edwardsiella sp. EA181011]RFT05188.1 hypothetical protein CGL57_02400 [Edwardsiella anguillarum]BET81063.1 hypothetical protein PBOPBF_09445 [Edwardsiella anguillarum]BET84351.1 hypothetical protein GHNJMD_09750 [Edwardsiella anguillarum]BET87718.1 hypothetical protein GBFDFA_09440 [Edwardsiella anguillarum]